MEIVPELQSDVEGAHFLWTMVYMPPVSQASQPGNTQVTL